MQLAQQLHDEEVRLQNQDQQLAQAEEAQGMNHDERLAALAERQELLALMENAKDTLAESLRPCESEIGRSRIP